MNWDAIAAVAELVAALGVIGSLIYLGVQIRQNTASLRANNLRDVIDTVGATLDRMTANPLDLSIYLKGRESSEFLSAEERERFWAIVAMQFGTHEFIFDLHRDGLVKPATYAASLRGLRAMLASPGVREIWKHRKSMVADDFQAFVDSLLDDRGPAA